MGMFDYVCSEKPLPVGNGRMHLFGREMQFQTKSFGEYNGNLDWLIITAGGGLYMGHRARDDGGNRTIDYDEGADQTDFTGMLYFYGELVVVRTPTIHNHHERGWAEWVAEVVQGQVLGVKIWDRDGWETPEGFPPIPKEELYEKEGARMRKGDTGPDVQEMQEALIERGYPLRKFGADGDFGDETMVALKAFQEDHGIDWGSLGAHVSQKTLDALMWDAPEDPPISELPERKYNNTMCYDLRDQPFSERVGRKFKRRAHRPVVRDPAQVLGITIHQTAAKFGTAPYQVHAANGDAELALARRSLRVACHVMAFHDGFIAWPNPLEWYVYHGNGFNSFELGLEIDGNYPGVKGGRTWNNKTPTEVTADVVGAACAAIELMVIEGRKLRMPIEFIHAHRQSSATRRSDPGEELWRRVVLDYAVPVLGLKTEQGRTLGKGRPIPKDWDPNGVGGY